MCMFMWHIYMHMYTQTYILYIVLIRVFFFVNLTYKLSLSGKGNYNLKNIFIRLVSRQVYQGHFLDQ